MTGEACRAIYAEADHPNTIPRTKSAWKLCTTRTQVTFFLSHCQILRPASSAMARRMVFGTNRRRAAGNVENDRERPKRSTNMKLGGKSTDPSTPMRQQSDALTRNTGTSVIVVGVVLNGHRVAGNVENDREGSETVRETEFR